MFALPPTPESSSYWKKHGMILQLNMWYLRDFCTGWQRLMGCPIGHPGFFSFKVSLSTWHDEIIASWYQGNEVFSACGREIFSFHGAGSFASEEQTPNVTFETLDKEQSLRFSCCWLLFLLRLCSCVFWLKWLPNKRFCFCLRWFRKLSENAEAA